MLNLINIKKLSCKVYRFQYDEHLKESIEKLLQDKLEFEAIDKWRYPFTFLYMRKQALLRDSMCIITENDSELDKKTHLYFICR